MFSLLKCFVEYLARQQYHAAARKEHVVRKKRLVETISLVVMLTAEHDMQLFNWRPMHYNFLGLQEDSKDDENTESIFRFCWENIVLSFIAQEERQCFSNIATSYFFSDVVCSMPTWKHRISDIDCFLGCSLSNWSQRFYYKPDFHCKPDTSKSMHVQWRNTYDDSAAGCHIFLNNWLVLQELDDNVFKITLPSWNLVGF